jgi:hypothetical protein
MTTYQLRKLCLEYPEFIKFKINNYKLKRRKLYDAFVNEFLLMESLFG